MAKRISTGKALKLISKAEKFISKQGSERDAHKRILEVNVNRFIDQINGELDRLPRAKKRLIIKKIGLEWLRRGAPQSGHEELNAIVILKALKFAKVKSVPWE